MSTNAQDLTDDNKDKKGNNSAPVIPKVPDQTPSASSDPARTMSDKWAFSWEFLVSDRFVKYRRVVIIGLLILLPLIIVIGTAFSFYKFKAVPITYEINNNLQPYIVKATELGRPYVILSALMIVEIENVTDGNKPRRVTHNKIIYTILPLRDITTKETVFKESYESSYADHIDHWPGTETEIFHGKGNIFEVVFDATQGVPKTLITGADFMYNLPLVSNRPTLGSSFHLSPTEDFEAYPNQLDVICKLTLIVESSDVAIEPIGQAAKHMLANRSVQEGDAKLNTASNESPKKRSISATWENLMPGEEVGIHFGWTESALASTSTGTQLPSRPVKRK